MMSSGFRVASFESHEQILERAKMGKRMGLDQKPLMLLQSPLLVNCSHLGVKAGFSTMFGFLTA